jgi:hypothetical protein
VLRDRTFDNSQGSLARRIQLDLQPLYVREIEEVFQALEIASNQRVGYVQVLLRSRDWADSWLGNLPTVEKIGSPPRLPKELVDYGWNRKPKAINGSKLADVPALFSNLQATHPRGKLAARRLFQSSLRAANEDTLLDACIGIEALLGEEHDELVHRMGLRASVALVPSGIKAGLAYEILKKVYSHRSKIVHGTEPKNSTISLRGKEFSASSVAVFLLRVLLKSHLSQTPSWTPADLDKTLFEAIDGQLRSREKPAAS